MHSALNSAPCPLPPSSLSAIVLPRHVLLFMSCFFFAFMSFLFAFSTFDLYHFRISHSHHSRFLTYPSNSASTSSPLSFSNSTQQHQVQCISPSSHTFFPLQPISPRSPAPLKRYATWHAAAKRCLVDPLCSNKPDVLIFHCQPGQMCGGLGDRLRGIHLTFGIAMVTNRLFLIDLPAGEHSSFALDVALHPASIDWRLPSSLHLSEDYILPALPPRRRLGVTTTVNTNDTLQLNWAFTDFDRCAIPIDGADYSNFKIRALGFVNLLSQSEEDASRIISAFKTFPRFTRIASNAPHAVASRMYSGKPLFREVAPEFKSYSISEILKFITHSLFISSPIVEQLASDLTFKQEWPYIAVHARTGGDVSEADRPRFASMAENYTAVTSALLECVVRRKKQSIRRIYLASDSVEFKTNFIQMATERYGINVKTLLERAVHIGKMTYDDDEDDNGYNHQQRDDEKEDDEATSQRNCKDFLNAFVDIAAMARAEFIVSTGSGFSKMAFFIGTTPRSLFIGYSSRTRESKCRPDFVGQ